MEGLPEKSMYGRPAGEKANYSYQEKGGLEKSLSFYSWDAVPSAGRSSRERKAGTNTLSITDGIGPTTSASHASFLYRANQARPRSTPLFGVG